MNHRYKAEFSESLDITVSESDELTEGGEFEDDMQEFDYTDGERAALDELDFEDRK